MPLSSDDLKTAATVVAVVISFISLYFTRVNWLHSNRPVLSVWIAEHDSGYMSATFNLVVANTGNRPAVNIRLHATQEQISALLEEGVSESRRSQIAQIFTSESEVPLLKNGDEVVTSFGAFVRADPQGPWLNYGASTQLLITYKDLDGRSYHSKLPVRIYARQGFGGSVWQAPTKA